MKLMQELEGGGTLTLTPDAQLRLDCLALAAHAKPDGDVVAHAKHYYDFVRGLPEEMRVASEQAVGTGQQ